MLKWWQLAALWRRRVFVLAEVACLKTKGKPIMEQIMNFLRMFWALICSFKFTDLVDIVFVSCIVYKVLQIVRETRAFQLLKGLLLFFVVAVLAKILNLKTLDFIIHSLILFGPLVIVVLFQSEFRRILEHFGRTQMSNKLQNFLFSEKDHINSSLQVVVELVVNACVKMSKNKVGAIIIFERKTKLADIIATGVILNADVSEELIKNLFFKNSPLHDGAVIIRGTKIVAASCFLPKPSKEEYISRELGSRHRAAIGMSENSDALVVVVSEENGAISVAENGKLIRNMSELELEKHLKKGLGL